MKSTRVTIDDIAKHACVSKATVSRVLNNPDLVHPSKQQTVLAAVKELGFQPNLLARGLASGQSMTIGIITQNIGTSFYDDIIRAIIQKLRSTRYSPIFGDGLYDGNAQAATVKMLCDRQVDGIIMIGGNATAEDLRIADGRPLLVVARNVPDWDGPAFTCDNVDLGYQATKHLIEQGHTAIGHVTGNMRHEDAVARTAGYRKAMDEAGIKLDPDWIQEGNFYGTAGMAAVQTWFDNDIPITAVFAANDLTAFGVNLALHRRGISVPDHISLVGIDNKLESELVYPPLTTMRQPASEMGHAAADGIVGLVEGKKVKSQTFVGDLIQRESVAAKVLTRS